MPFVKKIENNHGKTIVDCWKEYLNILHDQKESPTSSNFDQDNQEGKL